MALATLLRASYADGPPTAERADAWRALAADARSEYDALHKQCAEAIRAHMLLSVKYARLRATLAEGLRVSHASAAYGQWVEKVRALVDDSDWKKQSESE